MKTTFTYICPSDPVPVVLGTPGTIEGCGQTFTSEPDAEGWVDCPHCGLGFNPSNPENAAPVFGVWH